MGFFLASVLTPIGVALALYLWLRAISGWKYFYAVWTFIAVLVVAWLVVGFAVPIRHLVLNSEQPKDIVGVALSGLLLLPAWFEVPMPLVAVLFAIPTIVALLLVSRSRAYVQDQVAPPRSLTLLSGITVLAILVGLIGWHVFAATKLEGNRTDWKTMGGLANYDNGVLRSLSFLPGSNPPWKLLSTQKDLQYLSLSRCRVKDDDLKHLTGLTKLWELHLDGTEVTDACIPALEQMPALLNLSIYGTRITENGVQRLRRKLEPRRVHYGPEPRRPQKGPK